MRCLTGGIGIIWESVRKIIIGRAPGLWSRTLRMGSAICQPQVSNPVLLHSRQILYRLSHHRSSILLYPKFKNHWNKLYILPQIKPISVFSLFLKRYLKKFFFNLQNFSRLLDILCTNLEMILDRFRPSLLFILYIKAFKGK